MKKVLVFLLLSLSAQTWANDEATNTFQCLSGLHNHFSPYMNLAKFSEPFKDHRINKISFVDQYGATNDDAYVWTPTNSEKSDPNTKLKYVSTANGIFSCSIPSSLEDSNLVIDAEALNSESANILRRKDKSLRPRAGITCTKQQNFPNELVEKHVTWSLQLYEELLLDKTASPKSSKTISNYSPGNIVLNAFERCRRINYAINNEPIMQKRPRFDSAWNRVVRGQSSGAIRTTESSSSKTAD